MTTPEDDDERPPRPPSLADFESASLEELEALPPDMRRLLKAERAALALAKVDMITSDLTNEVALTEFDKCDWGAGPWQDEPDLLMWRSATPPHYRCQIARNFFGSLNGYVAIPPGHPAHGVSNDDDRLSGLPAHHGITFSGFATEAHWVLGFDCGHGFDIQPASNARLRHDGLLPAFMEGKEDPDDPPNLPQMPAFFRNQYRDLPYVRGVVEALAAALAKIEAAGALPTPGRDFDDDEPTLSELEP